jgi:predicted nucleic acid-binding protein
MTVVDSNTWADYFNGTGTPHVSYLDGLLRGEREVFVLPIVVTEVLQGFRTDSGFERARKVFMALPRIEPTLETHVRAARLFRTLRRKGVTVRGAVDCVIAQACIDEGAELLSPDVDFERIARHAPLKLWRP